MYHLYHLYHLSIVCSTLDRLDKWICTICTICPLCLANWTYWTKFVQYSKFVQFVLQIDLPLQILLSGPLANRFALQIFLSNPPSDGFPDFQPSDHKICLANFVITGHIGQNLSTLSCKFLPHIGQMVQNLSISSRFVPFALQILLSFSQICDHKFCKGIFCRGGMQLGPPCGDTTARGSSTASRDVRFRLAFLLMTSSTLVIES